MLSNLESETVRAALRYWLDEIVPHESSVGAKYLDGPSDTPLDRECVLDLIDRFEPSRLRYVVADPKTGRITINRLLTAEELAVLRDSRTDNLDSRTIHTVLVSDHDV
jgi:hypothetical protein